ncbi:dihydropteroate synthase [Undibacterium jejuense]|uniref:Dihydropteroate synthase n=1 Tax=Undibacterium jejuense TaxID=1344949 RepID=A0A923KPJ0_9BURK|nr:dihydropteroate synthase [Undibacterium jejuense]MBC3861761.1 dihydropteroate synthase [Undibacterium jejuense]
MTDYFQCGRYRIPLRNDDCKPLVMGILNVTPDSFSDGGKFLDLDSALSRAEQMIEDGVDIIDIGGESSRPGSQALSLDEELRRVMPVIFALRDCGKALSIDTYKPEVMREAILAGVDMINDIQGFRSPEAIAAVAESDVGLCIMHMQNVPSNMQSSPAYVDVVTEVRGFLGDRVRDLLDAGVPRQNLCVDPGFGFGKSLLHNIALFKDIPKMAHQLDLPVLVGVSRKTMIGEMTGRVTEKRLAGSLAAALSAANMGAKILRVHDVAETVDALKVWRAMLV